MLVVEDKLRSALKEYFGFNSFKGEQEEIIKSLMAGKDTFVIMPTGGGKSLCYQLPAIMSEGTAIIISPLIALMKNQVDLMRSYSSIDTIAHYMNSSLNKSQITEVKNDILERNTKLLYVAPESLTKKENIEFFKDIKVSFVAVDEAHCISEWGHDFRPEYRRIKTMIQMIDQDIPIIALTATATPKVRSDIIKNLQLREPDVFISSFNRPNLYYEVRPKGKSEITDKNIIQFIKGKAGKSGIIYVLSRRTAGELAKVLRVNDIKALPYHAGLDAATRSNTQDKFLMEEIDVIVATIAFGMGIDKPDVRFVIHYNIPKSIENYYQETGRAGRDGLEGTCIAYYSHKDIQRLEKFMKDKTMAEREMASQLLMEVIAYSETPACRRKFLLHYFGQDYLDKNCHECDNCTNPKERIEGRDYVLLALQTVDAVKENLGIQQIVNIILGKKDQEMMTFGYDRLEVFGKGKDKDDIFWNSVVRQALLNNIIRKDIENYGLIRFTPLGRDFMINPTSIKIALTHDFIKAAEEEEAGSDKESVLDPELFDLLRDLRKKVGKELNLPPYVVFQDPSLEDMSAQYPISLDELTNITGVSRGKASKYGKKFVELIAGYVEENDIDRPDDFVVKSVVNKSGLKVYIIQNIDKKIPLDDIADSKGLSIEQLLEEISTIVDSGTKVDLDYYIDEVVDFEVQDGIYDYFGTAESDSLDEGYKELSGEGITMEEIQLLRIKFMSEMAN